MVQLPGCQPPVKLLYFDCFSGAAGDMILGALIDAGLPLADLKRALGSLALDEWDISAERVVKGGITATQFRVVEHAHRRGDPQTHGHAQETRPTHAHSHERDSPDRVHNHPHEHHHHRTVSVIRDAIDRSALSGQGKSRAKALFDRLAEAEAAVHDMPIERVHLHEVGELDSIIDVVGAVFAFEWFRADRIVVSPMNVGSGVVQTAHGVFPVPAPATLRLLGNAPVYGRPVNAELLTPTGALILTEYAAEFGAMPLMRVQRTGYGAGERNLEGTPNVLRVVVGETEVDTALARVVVIECEIDDMNPQIFGALMDRLYATGALEVFYAPVQMKKNRPGTLATIIAHPDYREALTDLVFRETTTIGVRFSDVQRECLARESVHIDTPLGPVRFKVARRAGRVLNAQPEFDDITRIATDRSLPIKDVQAVAIKAWLDRQ